MESLLKVLDVALDATLTLLICNRLAPVCPRAGTDESETAKRYREFCERMNEQRLASIKIISEHRQLLAPEVEKRHIDSSALFEIDFLVSYTNSQEAQRMARRFEHIYVALSRLEAICDQEEQEATPTKRLRGRPRSLEVERKADELVARAWETSNFPSTGTWLANSTGPNRKLNEPSTVTANARAVSSHP